MSWFVIKISVPLAWIWKYICKFYYKILAFRGKKIVDIDYPTFPQCPCCGYKTYRTEPIKMNEILGEFIDGELDIDTNITIKDVSYCVRKECPFNAIKAPKGFIICSDEKERLKIS